MDIGIREYSFEDEHEDDFNVLAQLRQQLTEGGDGLPVERRREIQSQILDLERILNPGQPR